MNWVEYSTIRDKVKTGDVFWMRSNSITSWIIRLVTASKVSHCGFFVVVGGRVFTVEMLPEGCKMMLASKRFKNTRLIYKKGKKISPDAILKYVGVTKYDFVGCVLSPFVRTKGAEKYCAEFVADLLNIQYHVKHGIYPSDLLAYLS